MSEERKSAEAQQAEASSSKKTVEAEEEMGAEDLDQLIRDAQAAILQNRQETPAAEELQVDSEGSGQEVAQETPELDEGLDPKLEELRSQLAQKDQGLAHLKDRLLRLAAEFDNFKKRSRKERSDLVLFANEELIKQFLPVLDNFERALENGRQQAVPESFFKGIELIYNQASRTLERIGLKHIEVVGQSFDPNLHEAVMRDADSELPENTVVQEFRRGYSLNDKVIRQAMVSVSARTGGNSSKTNVEPNHIAKDPEGQPDSEAPADSAAVQSEPDAAAAGQERPPESPE